MQCFVSSVNFLIGYQGCDELCGASVSSVNQALTQIQHLLMVKMSY